MGEGFKNRVILILSISTVIFFIGTVSSCSSAFRKKSDYDKEMLLRMSREEELLKVKQDKTAYLVEIDNLKRMLSEDKAQLQALKNDLMQEKLVSQNLKDELLKASRLKETIEDNLKDTVKNKSRK